MPPFLRLRTFLCVIVFLSTAISVRGEKLSITSIPSGASVEIDGVNVGITPFEKDYPGGYFHRTKTVIGARLEHPMVARISLTGYATKELVLTQGPMEWISALKHANHGPYWLIKSTQFHVILDSIAATFTGNVTARLSSNADIPSPELSLEALVEAAKPAVVQLKGLEKMGSGFFVTEPGIIATNAHVAREEGSLLVLLSSGLQLEGNVVYVDPDLDIALVKIPGMGFKTLTLAAADTVKQGESVLAIGNPGNAMQFSLTKGIVSAVGKFPNAGPGTWVQTDAPINPGNSGGPPVNMRGEVVGMNTLKLVKKNVTGIGFALSASDLLSVLDRFYNVASQQDAKKPEQMAAPTPEAPKNSTRASKSRLSNAAQTGTVHFAGSDGATIFVDKTILGQVPSTLRLVIGRHRIRVTKPGYVDWMKVIWVTPDAELFFEPEFKNLSPPK